MPVQKPQSSKKRASHREASAGKKDNVTRLDAYHTSPDLASIPSEEPFRPMPVASSSGSNIPTDTRGGKVEGKEGKWLMESLRELGLENDSSSSSSSTAALSSPRGSSRSGLASNRGQSKGAG